MMWQLSRMIETIENISCNGNIELIINNLEIKNYLLFIFFGLN